MFQIIDMLEYENSMDPEITNGGLGEKFVEIKVASDIGIALDYLILVYSDEGETGVPSAKNVTSEWVANFFKYR